ncbi:MAG: uL30 family ribosomal protein [Candidatus Aenigmarchaeota archaeon]|nr:uL30 family ribosomal protein [Candidatus Aenigmarchaeota archaeon]
MNKIAIVRIRGPIRVEGKTEFALKLLGLTTPNKCALKEESPALNGTLQRIRPYVAWGVADENTLKLFGTNKTLALCPPRGGYGRKGVKLPFSSGGAYGDRKEKINNLIKRMAHGSS